MAECLDDLNLPTAIIARLIKDALPNGVSVTGEAKAAIARAASVFVLYLTNMSNSVAKKNSRKRIYPKDIFDSLKEVDFADFVVPLQDVFDRYKDSQNTKKKEKKDSINVSKDDDNDIDVDGDDNENESFNEKNESNGTS